MTHKPYHIYYTYYLTFYRKTSSIPVYTLNEMLTLSVLLFFLLVSAGSNWYTGAASILGATGVENWESKHPQYKLILNACFLPGAGHCWLTPPRPESTWFTPSWEWTSSIQLKCWCRTGSQLCKMTRGPGRLNSSFCRNCSPIPLWRPFLYPHLKDSFCYSF